MPAVYHDADDATVALVDDAAAERRRARAAWPVRRLTLGEDDPDVVPGTASERIAMVHQLTLDAWAMSGQPIPDYPRGSAPGLLRRAPR